jgi:hypothetical protein
MKRVLIGLILALCILNFLGEAGAATWYVDNAASGSNNGTSWTNAWQAFSSINWSSVSCGDTIYISGGSTSKTYSSTLKVAKSCSGSYLKIQTGQDAGHNGVVTISGASYGIIVSSKNYIHITGQVGSSKNMRLTNNTYRGLTIEGTSNHVIAEYIEIDNNHGTTRNCGLALELSSEQAGIDLRYLSIHDNDYQQVCVLQQTSNFLPSGYDIYLFHDSEIYNYHDDAIFGDLGGVTFYNNYIHDRTPPYRGHPDQYQLFNNYYKIYNSRHRNHYGNSPEMAGEGAIQGIYWEPNGGQNLGMTWTPAHFRVYNNLFEEPVVHVPGSLYVLPICLAFSDISWTGEIYDVYIVNNTFNAPSGGGMMNGIMLAFSGAPNHAMVRDIYIMNNVFYNASYTKAAVVLARGSSNDITYGSYGDSVDVVFDYNAFYGTGSTHVWYGNSLLTYANFKSTTGCQDHEVTADPLLDASLRPTSYSPIKDAGVSLSSYFTTDKDGVPRPQGSAWDIGAYEYIPDIPGPLAAPKNLRIQ